MLQRGKNVVRAWFQCGASVVNVAGNPKIYKCARGRDETVRFKAGNARLTIKNVNGERNSKVHFLE